MNRPFRLAVVALAMTAQSALAETPERCSLVGQMAGSVWLEMIQSLGDANSEAVESAILRLDALTGTYARIDCDQAALNATFDCVLTDQDGDRPRALLRRCMAENGIAQN